MRDPRRALFALIIALAALATFIWMQGCSVLNPWVQTPQIPAQFYLWHQVDLSQLRVICGAQPGSRMWEKGGACPAANYWGSVPPYARRMENDEEVGYATQGRLGIIYSTSSWAEAAWHLTTYPWEWRTLLEHEKHHLEGFVHPGWDAGR